MEPTERLRDILDGPSERLSELKAACRWCDACSICTDLEGYVGDALLQVDDLTESWATDDFVDQFFQLTTELPPITENTLFSYRPVGEGEDVLTDWVEHQMLQHQVQEVLSTLSYRERLILSLRFGLDDGCDRSLEEVGAELGLTGERIRQIEAKALRKFRHPSRSKKLRDYLE